MTKSKKKILMSLLIIQAKAHNIFEMLKAGKGGEQMETFTTSHRWFQQFCQIFSRRNLSISNEAVATNIEAAGKNVDQFDKVIEESSYHPEQIFNLDKTGLFWRKNAPKRSMESCIYNI
ncbi:hypothetical protein JRQ81_017563 [Phrynocephalus forsythii]|uniref:HTH CENPB-type domain-containing protein n=1 Tax=Phrynocephalus forsythii TaxID=171643 RepID=A0A9Q0XR72_9SAUR|nr:hypothetical protein JRQ81_017563 [Phrynocephalus forsythii]